MKKKTATKRVRTAADLKDGTYNCSVFWPKCLVRLIRETTDSHKERDMYPTQHAQSRIQEYGLPEDAYQSMLSPGVSFIEGEMSGGQLVKVITRRPSPEMNGDDWCAAIRFDNRDKPTVVTMWINRCNDRHRTLQEWNYVSSF